MCDSREKKVEKRQTRNWQADQFHVRACQFLHDQGFTLANDPTAVTGPYQETMAVYESIQGLFIVIGFSPVDGNNAQVTFGRRWIGDGGWVNHSNHYSVVAKRFGFDLPTVYVFGSTDDMAKTADRILADLTYTLPTLVENLTLEDLLVVEREDFGAQKKAEGWFGPDYIRHVDISEFPAG